MSENKQNVRNLVQIAAFTALLAIMAQISIPMPAGVPMTMQTLAVPLAGLILGANRGTLATVLYVLLGIFGVPVFAGFSGGPGIAFGITGGFQDHALPLPEQAAGLFEKGGNRRMKWNEALFRALGEIDAEAVPDKVAGSPEQV